MRSISCRTVANYYKIVPSSALKLYFFLPFLSRLIRCSSCRTVANYYKIVLSSALKLYFFLPFVLRLKSSISCRTIARSFCNCIFLYYIRLLLSSIYLEFQEIHLVKLLLQFLYCSFLYYKD